MRISLLAVTRLKSGPERELVNDYADRFRKVGAKLGFKEIKQLEVASGGGLDKEGERLLAKLPEDARAIRLDEYGEALASEALAQRLERWRDQGDSHLVLLIGGAEGFSDEVRRQVPARLSLGPATWPHKLVRVMITEQLYRAVSILAGTPYHKGPPET